MVSSYRYIEQKLTIFIPKYETEQTLSDENKVSVQY
jgi:hypothetical protein